MKANKISQKLRSSKSDLHFDSEIRKETETYRAAQQSIVTMSNFLFNFIKDRSQWYYKLWIFKVNIYVLNHRDKTQKCNTVNIR